MQNSDEASLKHHLVGQAFLMKMLITLEPCGIFGSKFVYKCILTFPAPGMQNGDEASPGLNLAG